MQCKFKFQEDVPMKTTNGFAIAAVVILSGGGVGCKSSSTPAQASLPSERTYSQPAAAAPEARAPGWGLSRGRPDWLLTAGLDIRSRIPPTGSGTPAVPR